MKIYFKLFPKESNKIKNLKNLSLTIILNYIYENFIYKKLERKINS